MELVGASGNITAVLDVENSSLRITNNWDRLQCNGITQVVMDGSQIGDLNTALKKLVEQMAVATTESGQSVREYVAEREMGGMDHEEPWAGRHHVDDVAAINQRAALDAVKGKGNE